MPKGKVYLAPDVILAMLLGSDNNSLKNLLDNEDFEFIISDFAIYESIESLNDSDEMDIPALKKLFQRGEFFVSGVRMQISDRRRKRLREIALKGENATQNSGYGED